MKTKLAGLPVSVVALVIGCMLALGAGMVGRAQVIAGQAVDESGAPQYRVDPFWPNPLPNKWSMQQVTGLSVDQMNHVWFLNRNQAAQPIELTAEGRRHRRCAVFAGLS